MQKHASCAMGALVLAAGLLAAVPAQGEVTRVSVTSRTELASGYEKIEGRVFVAVNPRDPHNTIVVDLDKAPVNAAGLVEFSADFYALRPKSGGNGAAIVDIVNRGRKTVLPGFNRAATGPDETGDAFLMKRGFTVVAVGWEFDVRGTNLMRIDAPQARDGAAAIAGIVRATFTPDRRQAQYEVGDLAAYTPVDPAGADTSLTVRDRLWDAGQPIDPARWSLSGNTVTVPGGLEPGRHYELSYRAAAPPVGGIGYLAVRDVAAWLKHDPAAPAPAKFVYAFGSSQSGRFLRTFLYEGFNSDERDRQVFDAMMIHIAGAGRLDLNRRWATPVTLATYAGTAYPFADSALRDPVSGAREGLLDNPRARRHQPKIVYTNTGVEYWGGRSAALTHMTPDAAEDIPLPGNVRSYFFAGAQHSVGSFPPVQTAGQQKGNPTDYWWSLRALLVSMDKWVKSGIAPPASAYPQLDRGTLVKASTVAFPPIPGVASPRTLAAGVRTPNRLLGGQDGAGAALPLLVPQVDADGNERAGIRLPEVAVPLATYTGWNFRSPMIGGADQLVPLLGSYVPFARTRTEREARQDPRRAIEERYPSRASYLARISDAASGLVKEGYLIEADVDAILKRASDHWQVAAGNPTLTSAAP